MVKNTKKIYIFDLGDTLRYEFPAKHLRSRGVNKQILLPGVLKKLKALKKRGSLLAVTSNQGAPSFGTITELTIWKFIIHFQERFLKGYIQDIRLDFYHPEGPLRHRYKNRRKPRPDLILDILADHKLKPKEAVYVGNAPTDKDAAERAGIDFIWAQDFFEWDKKNLELNDRFGWKWKKKPLYQELRKIKKLM